MQRDAEVNGQLEKLGYKVFRFWSRQVEKDLDGCVGQIVAHIRG